MDQIGFPPPLLGNNPARLNVLYNADGLLAIEKPASVLMDPHPWYRGLPSLSEALQFQVDNAKPELDRLGLLSSGGFRAVFDLDPGVAGVCLLAHGDEAIERYRNAFGSRKFEFVFHILTRGGPDSEEFSCDLPLAKHFADPSLLVSHTTGKKAETRFKLLDTIGPFKYWEVRSDYYRMNQLSLHALESRLPIIGDDKYAMEPLLYLSKLKKHYRGSLEDEKPLYSPLCAYLTEVTLNDGDQSLSVCSVIPKRFNNMLKQLKRIYKQGMENI